MKNLARNMKIVFTLVPGSSVQNGAHFLAHNVIFYASQAAVKKGTATEWKQAENLVIYCLNARDEEKKNTVATT